MNSSHDSQGKFSGSSDPKVAAVRATSAANAASHSANHTRGVQGAHTTAAKAHQEAASKQGEAGNASVAAMHEQWAKEHTAKEIALGKRLAKKQ